MPDSKISGLTSATTPLAGTEVLPIVQGGQTRQVSVANLTAGRSVDASTLTVTGNTYLATTSGSVGIGTSSPSYKLDVVGEVRANNLFRTTDGTNIGLFGSSVFAANVIGVGSSNSAPLVLGTAATERMRITSAGDVGIGTSSPVNTAGYGGLTLNGTSGAIVSMMENGTETFRLTNATGYSFVNTTGSTPLLFGTAATERMRITSAGDVGIGTSNPGAKLDVVGTAAISGAVTLSGGTANGVAYLNGSKVLTTGSALTFDGTNLGVTSGVTTLNQTVNGSALLATGTTGSAVNNYISLNHSPGGGAYSYTAIQIAGADIFSAGGNLSSYGGSAIVNSPGSTGGIIFKNYGAEGMRLTSTGLGIGTSSPAYKVDTTVNTNGINGYNAYGANGGASEQIGYRAINANSTGIFAGVNGFNYSGGFGSANQAVLTSIGNVALQLGTNSTVRATLDSSGNLGLGVTPSAWNSAYKAFQFSAGAIASVTTGEAAYLHNAFIDSGGNYAYVNSAAAARYSQINGQHIWSTAASGTAGNAISFTEAMTLDASGNLLVGSTSGYRGGRLVVKDVNRAQTSTLANLHVSTTDSQAADIGGSIGLGGQVGGDETPFAYISGRKENSTSGNYAGYLAFAIQDSSAAVTERMRINSSGNVGIGTTGPSVKLQVNGTSNGATLELLRLSNIGTGANTKSRLNFYAASTNYGSITGGYGASAPEMVFDINTTAGAYIWNNNATEQMRINASGNVGIGTSSPDAKLRVNGTAKIGEGAASNTSKLMVNTVSGVAAGIQLFQDANESWIIQNPASTTALTFANSGTERMRITSTGDVGIGTSSPAYKLDVVGSTTTSRLGKLIIADDTPFYTGANINSGANSLGVGSTGATNVGFFTNNLERMRITSAGDVGIGTSSPSAFSGYTTVSVNNATNGGIYNILVNGTETARLQAYSGVFNVAAKGASTVLTFETNATERMRITSAGDVGIGVTPMATGANGSQLQIGSPTVTPGAGLTIGCTTTADIQFSDATSGTGQYAGLIRYSHANDSMGFWTASNERMRLDSSGNLGLGVTPSAWNILKGFDISSGGALFGYTAQVGLANNAYYDGSSWRYKNTDAAAFFRANALGFEWHTAPSGTAGNAISFTQAMTLDASGDFIVGGTTTNGVRLTAEKSNPTRGIIAHVLNSGSSGLTGSQLMFTQNTVNNWVVGQPAGVDAFAFWSGRNTAADGTERMRIDSAGNLGLGVTPSAWSGIGKTLQIDTGGSFSADAANAYFAANAYYNGTNWIYQTTNNSARYNMTGSGQHQWFTAPSGTAGNAISFTQAMTLDASGNLLVGKTSLNAAAAGIQLEPVGTVTATRNGVNAYFNRLTTDGDNIWLAKDGTVVATLGIASSGFAMGVGGSERLRITSAGNIHTPAGATTMTNGFIYIPSAGGTPTGAATAITGTVPLYYDTTNNKLFIYNSSWQNIATAGSLPLLSTNANGVVYLNSSSQATTSTALQFNGTELGIGQAASAGIQVDVTSTSLTQIRARATTNGVDSRLVSDSSGLLGYTGTISNHPFAVYTNNTERMRITAAGAMQLSPTGGEGGELNLLNSAGGTVGGYVDVSTTDNFRLWTGNLNATMQIGQLASTGGNIQFYTAATERMRITSTGTVGIGTSTTSGAGLDVKNDAGGILVYAYGDTATAGNVSIIARNTDIGAGSLAQFGLWNDQNPFAGFNAALQYYSNASTIPNEFRIVQGANAPMTFYTNGSERMRITGDGNFLRTQAAHSTVNTSSTLNIAQVQSGIIVSTPATNITITLPTGTTLESYTANMPVGFSFELTIILVTGSGGTDITIAANGNTFYPSSGTNVTTNGPSTLRFRKTATNTFSVYRLS